MFSKKVLLWISFAAIVVSTALGECDICQLNNSVACHSSNVFSLCIDGKPTRDYIDCPANYVCASGDFVCYPRTEVEAGCIRKELEPVDPTLRCDICNEPNRVFACIDANTIAFCFGNNKPNYEAIAHCPIGTVCDLDNSIEFCTPLVKALPSCNKASTSTTNSPTTTTAPKDYSTTTTAATTKSSKITEQPSTASTTPASTTPALRDPDVFCQEKGTYGSYKPDGDTTCKKFIVCYKTDMIWYGLTKECPQGQFFDPESSICKTTKPEGCP